MKFTSLTTKLCLILSALFAFAFNGDDDSFYFTLSSNRIYSPGDPGIAIEFSGNNVGGAAVKFRAFRIDNPVEFFLAQKDPHSPTLSALETPNTFDMLRMGYEKVKNDARYAARNVMPADARRALRDVADLNGVRADQRDKGTNAAKPTPQHPTDDLPKGAEKYEIAASWERKLTSKRGENWTYESVPVPIQKKGVYLIEARTRGKRAITALIISEAGMVIKQADDKTVAFLTNRRTGQKITDFPLLMVRGTNKILDEETGSDGTISTTLPPLPKTPEPVDGDEDDWRWHHRQRQLLVLGEKDGDFVISDPYYYGYDSEGKYRVYLHTDRPVYRPAQSVFYRGIVRRILPDGTYENITGARAFIEVRDPRDGLVKNDTLTLSDMGTFSGQLQLGEEPPLGSYIIKATVEGEDHWFNFSVEEYKKPEYKVEVTTDREQYTRGDVITAKVEADYFFGSPVANAQVEYFVYRSRYWRPWWRGSEWAYLYEESDEFATYRMEMVHSGQGTLQPDGTFSITYQTDRGADQDYVYRIQANVVDNSRRSISGAKSVEVTRGEFYITTRTDKYVYKPGDDAKIDVTMATFDGDRPVAKPFEVKVVRTWWDRVGQRDRYDYKERTETVWTGKGSTGADGKGSVSYSPKRAGYFRVEITATDGRGTRITESTYIYVADESYADWYREGASDVQIIPDKQSYMPGETISALVVMPASNIDVLISSEGAALYNHRVERLNSNSAIVHVPVEERFAPVFFLNATAIVNDQMYSESKRITVVPKGKMIRVEVTTDKAQYKPGDRGTLFVRAVNEQGEPVTNTDIAIAMVDEAVYSIQPDATPDIQRYFYGNRWNEVATSSSLHFGFYGGARAESRRGDALFSARDEAAEGSAVAKTAAPPAAPQMAGRMNFAFGDVKGEMFVEPTVRKDFKDMMFWMPSVRTGADGRAKLEVNFPDNLTTWRITARGVTANTAVGQATAHVIARKDLLVRMETPRFLVQGDELLIATTVHNYLKGEKIAKVQLTGENVTLDSKERTITMKANGEQRIDWRVTAPKTGSAKLTVKALTNEESDAVELIVPVLPRGLQIASGQSADLEDATGTRTMTLTLPENSDATTGAIYVNIAPSLASSLIGALDQLIGYPYGCVEQTMSRFLPTVVVATTLQQLDVPFKDATKQAEIPKMVAKGLQRLYGMQQQDGGWGWWHNDQSDPFMTAYVVYGMTIARNAGFDVVPERYNAGINALQTHIDARAKTPRNRAVDATTEAYMLYVMSVVRGGTPEKALSNNIAALAKRDTLNNYARALLALGAQGQGQTALARQLADALERNVTTNGSMAFWRGKHWHYNWQDDQVETSAFAIQALMKIKGESELVKKGVRWLLTQRSGDAWHNTRQTAMVIYAMTDYLHQSRELDPDYNYTVKVNGKEVLTGRMRRADVFAEEKQVKIDRAMLNIGANTVTIEKSGNGKLYAAARMVYYATGPAIQPQSAGFRVTREYYSLRKEKKGSIYVYTKRPFTGTVKTGDEIFVRVKVQPDSRYEYFMLEDPLPAGCEVVKNTDGYTIPGEPQYDEAARNKRGYYGWYWWYADRDVRDEKIAFFARTVMPEEYEFSYIMRAQIPGKYSVMPSLASLMYYPEVRGNSGPIALSITE